MVRLLYVSLDPAMHMSINDARSYWPPVGIESNACARRRRRNRVAKPAFHGRDHVSRHRSTAIHGDRRPWRDKSRCQAPPLPKYLDIKHAGHDRIFRPCRHRAAETGRNSCYIRGGRRRTRIVGQIAKIKGCRVIGIAGGPEGCRLHRRSRPRRRHRFQEQDMKQARARLPNGIDIYFDNVGGAILMLH